MRGRKQESGADILPNARSKNMEGYKGKFKTWKEIREKMFFFQKLMNFENVLKQNCNKI